MKTSILAMLLLFFAIAPSTAQKQRITDISFSYFIEPKGDLDMDDGIQVDGYKGKLHLSSWVSENPATKATIIKLLNNLKSNGTEDINKCFTPRHAITVYSYDTVLYRVLVCFECDGIRFSNQIKDTRIKSVTKREKWMGELKAIFIDRHFDEQGITVVGY